MEWQAEAEQEHASVALELAAADLERIPGSQTACFPEGRREGLPREVARVGFGGVDPMIRWRMATLVATAARRLQRLANRLHRLADELWMPMSRDEAVQLMADSDPLAVDRSLGRVRKGLLEGVVPSRAPLDRLTPQDLAGLPTEILLDLYAAEVASGLTPTRRVLSRLAVRRRGG